MEKYKHKFDKALLIGISREISLALDQKTTYFA